MSPIVIFCVYILQYLGSAVVIPNLNFDSKSYSVCHLTAWKSIQIYLVIFLKSTFSENMRPMTLDGHGFKTERWPWRSTWMRQPTDWQVYKNVTCIGNWMVYCTGISIQVAKRSLTTFNRFKIQLHTSFRRSNQLQLSLSVRDILYNWILQLFAITFLMSQRRPYHCKNIQKWLDFQTACERIEPVTQHAKFVKR